MRQIEKIFHHLNPKQHKRFADFLASPFFFGRKNTLDQQALWQDMVKSKGTIPPKWQNKMANPQLDLLVSDLLKNLLRFLRQVEFEESEDLQLLLEGRVAQQSQSDYLWRKYLKKAESRQKTHVDELDYLFQYAHHRLAYIHSRHQFPRQGTPDQIEGLFKGIGRFALLESLRYLNEAHNQEKVLGQHTEKPCLSHLMKAFPKSWWEDETLIFAFKELLNFQQKLPELSVLKSWIEAISNEEQVPLIDRQILARQLINLVSREVLVQPNANNLELLFQVCDLLQQDQHNQFLSPGEYKNMCTLALRTGRVQYAREFTQQAIERVPEQNRAHAFLCNSCLVEIYAENIPAARKHLRDLVNLSKPGDVYLSMETRLLQVRISIAEEEWKFLENQLNNLERWLVRNKDWIQIEESRREYYLKLARLMKQILGLDESSDPMKKWHEIWQNKDQKFQNRSSGLIEFMMHKRIPQSRNGPLFTEGPKSTELDA